MEREWLIMMANYGAWQNRSLIEASDTLTAEDLKQDRGAFFGSILGTFSHLLWGDHMWMSRFDGGAAPNVLISDSATYIEDWDRFKQERSNTDARILNWAKSGDIGSSKSDLTWFSGAAGREVRKPYRLIYTHFFNHQTHHRGQIHKMLTEAGAKPRDTDLFLMPDQ